MPKPGFMSITVPEHIYDYAQQAFTQRKDYYKSIGVRSLSAYIQHHILRENMKTKINMRFTVIPQTVTDSLVIHDDEINRVIEIDLMNEGRGRCFECESFTCVHVGYAMSMPELWGESIK